MRFRWQESSLVVDAPAKLNLFLGIRGRRPDGYHDLETVMVSIGLFDTLRLTPAPPETLRFVCRSPSSSACELPADSENLALRAARLLADSTGSPSAFGAHIELVKRIPVASGMGGGSSDAAAALVGLNALWKTELDSRELHGLAADLGSDVNFFLDSAPLALCTGRGELVDARPLRSPLHFVVFRPEAGLSTAAVFQGYRDRVCEDASFHERSPAGLLEALARGRLGATGGQLFNDLQQSAVDLDFQVGCALHALSQRSVYGCLMTGSGSACYGLCASSRHARSLGAQLRANFKGRVWTVRHGRFDRSVNPIRKDMFFVPRAGVRDKTAGRTLPWRLPKFASN